MTTKQITRRRMLGAIGTAGALAAVPACRKRSRGGDGGGSAGTGGGRIKVGLVIPQSGGYAPLGVDMKRGWDLWLERHGGRLGKYEVTTVVADEGELPQVGVAAVQKLIHGEQVDVLVGVVSSAVALGSQNAIREAGKLLIVSNAGAGAITGTARSPHIWRTSFTNAQISSVMGQHLAKIGVGPVYALAPDYAAGIEVLAGFQKGFTGGGGKMAGEAKPPAFGKTQDYQPFLSGIKASGAKATFAFFSGAEAVTFISQYSQFGLGPDVPLFGSGFLTEGSVLDAVKDAAVGIQTTLHYSTELDNPANREFLAAYRARYQATPTCFTVQTWDAANVLDRALGSTAGLDSGSLAAALQSIGAVEDSPRGAWTFDGQSPRQNVYLRVVEKKGAEYVNKVVEDLGVFAQVA